MKKGNSIIDIEEDVQVPGTDIILEAGDRIEVLKEATGANSDLVYELSNLFQFMDIGEILAVMIESYRLGKMKGRVDFEDAKKELTSNLRQFMVDSFDMYA